MSALVLKSGNSLSSNVESLEYTAYRNRVELDGGIIMQPNEVTEALAFASSEGIASQVFSATSAKWGVKIVNGILVKMYSLFNQDGDIEVNISTPSAFNFNNSGSFPYLEFRGGTNNSLASSGLMNNVDSLGVSVVARVPDHANSTSGALVDIGVPTVSSTLEDLANKRYLGESIIKKGTTKDEWTLSASGFGSTGGVSAWGTGVIAGSGMSVFKDGTVYLDANDGSLLSMGTSIISKKPTPSGVYKSGLQVNIGRGRNATVPSQVIWTQASWADIAEVWVLANTTKDKMMSLSFRASEKY